MLACHYDRFGGPEVDEVSLVPKPGPLKAGQVLVRVHASSLNPADFKQRSGAMRMLLSYDFPQVHGFDFSGEVESSRCDAWAVGDEVFGMCKGLRRGGLAEFMVVDGDICARKPKAVSHEEAASVPLVGITTVLALRKCGLHEDDVAKGPRVLVTGGAGGVGSVAIQLAKSLFGASFVATTASAGAKTELCKSLGADRVVDYRAEDFSVALASEDEAERFDAVLDCTGEASKCTGLLRQGGGLVSIMDAPTALALREFLDQSDTLNFQRVTVGVAGFVKSRLGASLLDRATGARALRTQCEKVGGTFAHVIGTGNGEIMALLASELASGRLKAVIDNVYELTDALEAMRHIEGGHAAGKVVVRCIGQAAPKGSVSESACSESAASEAALESD